MTGESHQCPCGKVTHQPQGSHHEAEDDGVGCWNAVLLGIQVDVPAKHHATALLAGSQAVHGDCIWTASMLPPLNFIMDAPQLQQL